MEVAQEEDAQKKEGGKGGQVIASAIGHRTLNKGAWCNTAASRAPVMGMIANGSSDVPVTTGVQMMINWSVDLTLH